MTSRFGNLVRMHLQDLEEYEPIEPPEVLARRLNIPVEDIVKLDGNENPYGPEPNLYNRLSSYTNYHIYPDPHQRIMRQALSDYTLVNPSNIVVGSGCDELIDLLLRLTLEPGDEVIDCIPTFGMYAFCTRVCGGSVVRVPRTDDFQVDLNAVIESIGNRTKVVFLTSPNNPTGNLVTEEILSGILDTGVLVVVDETYYEFSGHTFASLVSAHENLIVLRSMSKWAGLASLRIGYGIMSNRVASYLMAIKPPYNVNGAAQVALVSALENRAILLNRVEALVKERQWLSLQLAKFKAVQPLPSSGNFILCKFIGKSAHQVNQELIQRGIFTRHFNNQVLQDYLRITVPTRVQSDVLLNALGDIIAN
jgi:histidinol-phosphate aminotransferase